MKLQLIETPGIKIKGETALIIFPSRPYWFSASKEVVEILKIIETKTEEELFIKKIEKKLQIKNQEAKEIANDLKQLLFKNNVLLINNKKNIKNKAIKPYYQLEETENVLVLAATNICNLNCAHCYANANEDFLIEMSTSEIKSVIDQLSEMPWKNKVSRIGLTGGEFFMRKDALEIIAYVSAKNFNISLSTNGVLLNKEIIFHLKKNKNLKISISLDGPSAEIHELIRGNNTFTNTVWVIKELVKNEIFVGVNMFVHKENIFFLEQMLELVLSLGVNSFNCLNLMCVGRANKNKKILERVSEKELNLKLFNILRKNVEYQRLMENSTFANKIMGIAAGVKSYYCGIGTNRALYVKPDGKIYPCPDTAIENFYLGDLKNDSLREIWKNSPILKNLSNISVDNMNNKCKRCEVRYFCGGGCRGENYQVTKELYSPHFNCKEIKETIFDIMWMLSEEPDFFSKKTKELYEKI